MSGVPAIVPHILSSDLLDRCDLSERWGRERCSPRHLNPTMFLQKKKKEDMSPPLTRNTVCSQFPPLTFFNAVSRFLELGGDNSRSPFLPPSQRWHCEVTASITPPPPQPSHIICWLVSQNRDFLLKVPFNTNKCGLWPLANVLFALNTWTIHLQWGPKPEPKKPLIRFL